MFQFIVRSDVIKYYQTQIQLYNKQQNDIKNKQKYSKYINKNVRIVSTHIGASNSSI